MVLAWRHWGRRLWIIHMGFGLWQAGEVKVEELGIWRSWHRRWRCTGQCKWCDLTRRIDWRADCMWRWCRRRKRNAAKWWCTWYAAPCTRRICWAWPGRTRRGSRLACPPLWASKAWASSMRYLPWFGQDIFGYSFTTDSSANIPLLNQLPNAVFWCCSHRGFALVMWSSS